LALTGRWAWQTRQSEHQLTTRIRGGTPSQLTFPPAIPPNKHAIHEGAHLTAHANTMGEARKALLESLDWAIEEDTLHAL
jgi:hypothetical protein